MWTESSKDEELDHINLSFKNCDEEYSKYLIILLKNLLSYASALPNFDYEHFDALEKCITKIGQIIYSKTNGGDDLTDILIRLVFSFCYCYIIITKFI